MNLNTATYYDDYWGGDACKAYLSDRQLDEIAAYIYPMHRWLIAEVAVPCTTK